MQITSEGALTQYRWQISCTAPNWQEKELAHGTLLARSDEAADQMVSDRMRQLVGEQGLDANAVSFTFHPVEQA
jgi:hypothetical protein